MFNKEKLRNVETRMVADRIAILLYIIPIFFTYLLKKRRRQGCMHQPHAILLYSFPVFLVWVQIVFLFGCWCSVISMISLPMCKSKHI